MENIPDFLMLEEKHNLSDKKFFPQISEMKSLNKWHLSFHDLVVISELPVVNNSKLFKLAFYIGLLSEMIYYWML